MDAATGPRGGSGRGGAAAGGVGRRAARDGGGGASGAGRNAAPGADTAPPSAAPPPSAPSVRRASSGGARARPRGGDGSGAAGGGGSDGRRGSGAGPGLPVADPAPVPAADAVPVAVSRRVPLLLPPAVDPGDPGDGKRVRGDRALPGAGAPDRVRHCRRHRRGVGSGATRSLRDVPARTSRAAAAPRGSDRGLRVPARTHGRCPDRYAGHRTDDDGRGYPGIERIGGFERG
mmetsp:Transcript_4624/g.20893  ORF Transcript_4624/g.20893 Transcript_4624/m.20893 type:complete len:232 (+) Transcript_4624:1248-1943(+)